MKRIVSFAVLVLILFVATSTFAEHDHIGNFNFRVEIEGVTQGVVKVKAVKAKTLTCPKASKDTVVTYNFFEAWPSKVQIDGLKKIKTHIISSGKRKITLSGVSSASFDKKKKSATFKFDKCS